MTYFAQDGALHSAAPVTAIVCDACASETVPFEVVSTTHYLYQSHDPERFPPPPIHWRQCHPWKWAPWYGGNSKCRDCGRSPV